MRVSEIACLKFLHTHTSQTVVDAGTGSIGKMLYALQKKAFLTMGRFLYNRPSQKVETQYLLSLQDNRLIFREIVKDCQ